jgi:hypothetical protein
MFAFFLNGIFFDFWANKAGDEFFDLTVKGMNWNPSSVSLVRFPGIPVRRPEFFRFEENGDLVIQEKQTTEGEIQEEILVDIQTIAVENYVLNGEKILPC